MNTSYILIIKYHIISFDTCLVFTSTRTRSVGRCTCWSSFGGPVHAEDTGIIPAGILFFQQFWFARDLGNRYFHGIFRHVTENHGKADTSTWMFMTGTGNQDLFGNGLGGNGKSRLHQELFGRDHGSDICTGTGKNHFPCNPAGIFPSMALVFRAKASAA